MRENLDVTITVPGHAPVHTTTEAIKKAGDDLASTRFAKDQLKSIIERIERLTEEKQTFSDDIRDVYAEAKGNGFNPKALRVVIRKQRADAKKAAELAADVDAYMSALGMTD